MTDPTGQATALTPDQLAFLRGVDSPTIANAIEPFKVRDRTEGFVGGAVRCLFPDLGVMVGHALTVTLRSVPGSGPNRDGYWRMWEALDAMPRPSVLVLAHADDSEGPTRCAHCGEVMATMARRLGAVGIVSDGGLRDLAEVRALGMHYHGRYVVVSHGNSEIVDVGVPVTLDGQAIRPGDILHGDANGIVVVPPETLDGLPAAVETVRENERRLMDFIKGENFTLAGAKEGKGY